MNTSTHAPWYHYSKYQCRLEKLLDYSILVDSTVYSYMYNTVLHGSLVCFKIKNADAKSDRKYNEIMTNDIMITMRTRPHTYTRAQILLCALGIWAEI